MHEAILEEAMDWFLRLKEPSRTPACEQDFRRWLDRSTAHRDAWTKACRTWELLGETIPVHEAAWRSAPAKASAPRRHRRAWAASAALAMAACLILFLAGPSLMLRYRADFTTATAELRNITLEDGSIVELGAASAIDTDFTHGRRHVTLLAGDAFFDVSHDPARPFTVTAGKLKVTVLGTAFDVQLKPEETTIELLRGVVSFALDGERRAFELSPGDSVSVSRLDSHISRRTLAPENMAAWRNGRLFVENVTIASVVTELQRYHPAWINIANSELATRRVTGLYNLADPDHALEALAQPYGGKVHRISPYLRVLSPF
jgi:transmembrane sensor